MKIFKYPIDISEHEQQIVLPRGAKIISLVCQREGVPVSKDYPLGGKINQLYFHAIVDPQARTEHRSLWCVGTGWDIPNKLKHIATTQIDGFVWHLLEKDNQKEWQ